MKKKKKKVYKNNEGYTMVNSIKSYANDPVFLEKARRSKEFLDKHGFPDELLNKK